jgi:DNA-binding NtrC family response regulator
MAYRSSTLVPPSVLLVDDEASFVETLSKRIAKRDLKVSTAFSGPEALEKLKSGGGASNFDVVILDVKMPGMDGLETLAAIKLKHPNVEVIMLTGHATVESAIEGMKAGAFDYLMKPCDIDLLLAKIDRAVVKKREHEEKILQAKAQMIVLKRGF